MQGGTPIGSSGPRVRDYRCGACGYQIAIPRPHPICPMCSEDRWTLIAPARGSLRTDVRADRTSPVTSSAANSPTVPPA
jgi:hypothetical protein